MNKRTVVAADNLPIKFPVYLTWLQALSQTVWDWPDWVLGILWFILAVLWIIAGVDIWNRTERNPFKSG